MGNYQTKSTNTEKLHSTDELSARIPLTPKRSDELSSKIVSLVDKPKNANHSIENMAEEDSTSASAINDKMSRILSAVSRTIIKDSNSVHDFNSMRRKKNSPTSPIYNVAESGLYTSDLSTYLTADLSENPRIKKSLSSNQLDAEKQRERSSTLSPIPVSKHQTSLSSLNKSHYPNPNTILSPFRVMKMHITSTCHSQTMSSNKTSISCNLQLTSTQILLVRKTWAHARSQGALEPAMAIFRNSFFKDADIRSLIMSGSKNIGYDRLKKHAKEFTGIMDKLMSNLENAEILVEDLKLIGKAHITVTSEHYCCPFRTLHLDSFASAMIERTLEWGEKKDRTGTTQTAWTKIVLFLIEGMKEGYNEGIRQERRARQHWQPNARGANDASFADMHSVNLPSDGIVQYQK